MSHLEKRPEITADEAIRRLKEGNRKFLENDSYQGNFSKEIRHYAATAGQKPYAIVICCSDSRVIPEAAFQSDIGDLFVIRIAGNVIDNHQLGSIEYAADHLGSPLVVVLGHSKCGAVDAAMNHNPDGFIKYITDEISLAIGDEKDERRACCLNVKQSVRRIESSLEIQEIEDEVGLRVIGALYDIETGEVEFEI
ncbi:MAG: carbonic anhydrase [Clostridia bacterium]|nr:carbonic anhydrase [Clostridia bacterium]